MRPRRKRLPSVPIMWQNNFEVEKAVFSIISSNGDGVFRIARQMDCTNQDVVGENWVCNDTHELVLTNKDMMTAWVENYARLINVEFEWPSNELHEVFTTADPIPACPWPWSAKYSAIWNVARPLTGPSGIIAEMLKAGGEEEVELVSQLAEAVFSSGEIRVDWEEIFFLNLYEGKGEAFDRGNYCGLYLTDQVMRLLEWVLDFHTHKVLNIDEMQFGFVPGRCNTEAIFIVSGEAHCCQNTALLCPPSPLRKKLIMCQGRSCSGPWGVSVSRNRLCVSYRPLGFGMRISVQPGSMLFIQVMEAPLFYTGVEWELLCVDDLVLIAKTLEECIFKLKAWRTGAESKGLPSQPVLTHRAHPMHTSCSPSSHMMLTMCTHDAHPVNTNIRIVHKWRSLNTHMMLIQSTTNAYLVYTLCSPSMHLLLT